MTREEAINNLESLYNEIYNEDSDGYIYAEAIDMAIEALQDKSKGKWLIFKYRNSYKCSKCQEVCNRIFNYCPNCGASMEGGIINDKTRTT